MEKNGVFASDEFLNSSFSEKAFVFSPHPHSTPRQMERDKLCLFRSVCGVVLDKKKEFFDSFMFMMPGMFECVQI